jgi:hypothetical protein
MRFNVYWVYRLLTLGSASVKDPFHWVIAGIGNNGHSVSSAFVAGVTFLLIYSLAARGECTNINTD